GIAYAYDRGLEGHRTYLLGWQAVCHLLQGRLEPAADSAKEVFRSRVTSGILRVNPLCVVGRLWARRGDPEVWPPLDEALALAEPIGEIQRIGPARIACAEAAWLGGDDACARDEAERALPLALEKRDHWIAGELLVWQKCAGGKVSALFGCPQP